jgi:hypothetical protein
MTLCLHCEKRPQQTLLRLCSECEAVPGIKNLYEYRPDWTPEWDQHLQALVERAKQRLPLFPHRGGKQ